MRRDPAPALSRWVGLAVASALAVAACGTSHGDASPVDAWRSPTTTATRDTRTATTTTTTTVATGPALAIDPASGPQSTTFQLRLTGASPGDRISFEVRSPQGVFTGRAHEVPSTGTVSATYQTSIAGNIGRFTVIAHGSSGPVAAGSFDVVANTGP